MKKLVFLLTVLLASVSMSFSQNPPHPNGGGGPGGGNTPVGGGAPIDGGLSVLMVLATAYAFKKSYKVFNQKSKN
jgi:hypothetical protein